MTKKFRNWSIAAGIVAFPFVLFLAFLFSHVTEPPPSLPPLPNPNGYDDLVKAGEMVSTNSWNYDSTTLEQLRETTKANAEALALARAGLSNECRMPLQFTLKDSDNIQQLIGFRNLALAFAAEGKLAELENHPANAAKSYLDTIHLGNESARGGRLVEGMIGTAIESLGTDHLTNLVDQLDAKSCRETAATLETLDAQRQTWNEVMQQEHNWSRRAFPGIRNELTRIMERSTINATVKKTEQTFKEHQKQTRQLIIDLAARAYELDKSKPPTSISNLVPDYLKAVPQDPFTGTNMDYLPK